MSAGGGGQARLFCPCGQDVPALAGLCRRCYRSASHSRFRFGGLRDAILSATATFAAAAERRTACMCITGSPAATTVSC